MSKILGNIAYGIVYTTIVLLLTALVGALTALLATPLWNFVMPDIFRLPHITWIQMWGLIVLLSILIPTTASRSSKKDG